MRLTALLCFCFFCGSGNAQKYHLFIGTYTGTGSKGIYVYEFDAATGKAAWVSNTDSVSNPSFLALAPNGKTLYACNEDATSTAGRVSAFRFNKTTGRLSLINQQATGGNHPCYVSVDKAGRWLMAANYSSGSVTAFPLNTDGSIQAYKQLVQHTGSSINTARQESAHVHAAVFSPASDYLFTPDLGIDKVMAYRIKPSGVPLQQVAGLAVTVTPGSGPRHFEFHPNGKWAYLMQELTGTVVAYAFKQGALRKLQEIAAHEDTATGAFGSADIHVSPDGKFLYASNRGQENNLTIFKIDAQTGKLSIVGYQPTGGIKPRNFCIEPSGKYLLAANQESNNIVVFSRDKKTGLLTATGEQLQVPKPVCLKMMKKE